MTVFELLIKLCNMPLTAEVLFQYDGALRGQVEHVWLTRTGDVGLGQEGEPLYYTEDRPSHAPAEKDKPYWRIRDEHTTNNPLLHRLLHATRTSD